MTDWKRWTLGAGVGMLFLLFVMAGAFTAMKQSAKPAQAACGGSVSAPNLDAEAKQNAAIILGVVQSRGLPIRAGVIAITAALDESGLHNVNHGDAAGPDSRGLFQQRASWGPESVRMDPKGATGLFLDALVKVANWQALPIHMAAQAVQQSGTPDGSNYARFETEAEAIVGTFTPDATCQLPTSGPGQPGNPLAPCVPTVTQGYGPTSFALEPPAHGFPHFHGGKDLACSAGTPIHNIEYAGKAHVTISAVGYGNHVDVEIQAPDGHHYFVRYAHMATVTVQDGQIVQVGDQLGTEGTTGASTGPHLHFGVYLNGQTEEDTIDPSSWLTV